ncbi:prephenate dehydratase [Methylomonas sp. SURF-2]|uniref:Bifunctional chorismate mutase/prephenate dehydratase n=1 Tax=Methylomonas subterranea TaxID=2952225 RepID=A0ABT1TBE5_9GAMM|nr:prephenate dehydratase [Methylomonas sp. SURF-2]MCQ8102785.1 prephenate dehydratase [Methylomonas sp. SURF-2]
MTSIIPLSELRTQIDAIDQQILQLINQRAHCAIEVARTKQAEGETGSFYRPDREAQVLRRIKELNPGPLSDDAAAHLFREVMSACLALEKPLEVAYLGPQGTFTQQAAFKHFGHAVKDVPVATIHEIFQAVETGHCQFGVVPVENSTEGVIAHTLDRFMDSPLKICGEVEIRVHQNLLGKMDSLIGINEVFSHQQSLAQCRQWLNSYLPGVPVTAVSSNAEAARLASLDHGKAAIAGLMAAELYDLNIIEKHIEDEANNTTRFIVIGAQQPVSTGLDKTSILVSTGNQSGALYRILGPFAEYGISMVHIESRPSRQGLWDYVFFIDIEGHRDDEAVAKALQVLQSNVKMLKILGSYPKAVI